METCVGCGAEASEHPMVGVGHADLIDEMGFVPLEMLTAKAEWRAFPVCQRCYLHGTSVVVPGDPPRREVIDSRKVSLRMHFFPRSSAIQAVGSAGRAAIG